MAGAWGRRWVNRNLLSAAAASTQLPDTDRSEKFKISKEEIRNGSSRMSSSQKKTNVKKQHATRCLPGPRSRTPAFFRKNAHRVGRFGGFLGHCFKLLFSSSSKMFESHWNAPLFAFQQPNLSIEVVPGKGAWGSQFRGSIWPAKLTTPL